jgi:hypothetical protein
METAAGDEEDIAVVSRSRLSEADDDDGQSGCDVAGEGRLALPPHLRQPRQDKTTQPWVSVITRNQFVIHGNQVVMYKYKLLLVLNYQYSSCGTDTIFRFQSPFTLRPPLFILSQRIMAPTTSTSLSSKRPLKPSRVRVFPCKRRD